MSRVEPASLLVLSATTSGMPDRRTTASRSTSSSSWLTSTRASRAFMSTRASRAFMSTCCNTASRSMRSRSRCTSILASSRFTSTWSSTMSGSTTSSARSVTAPATRPMSPFWGRGRKVSSTIGAPLLRQPLATAGCWRHPHRVTGGDSGGSAERLQLAESAAVEHQRSASGLVVDVLDGVQLEQDEDVVSGLDLLVDGAVELREPVVQRDRTRLGHRVGDAFEAVFDRAGQLAAHDVVVVGEHGDAEVARPAQAGPGLRGRRQVDRDQRRLDAHRSERAGRESGQLAVDLRSDRDHAGGEDPERLAEPGRVQVLVGGEGGGEGSHAVRPFRWSVTTGRVAASQSAYAAGSSCWASTTYSARPGTVPPSSVSTGRSVSSGASEWAGLPPSISGTTSPDSPVPPANRSRNSFSSPV